jgi:hypothetical protein
MLDFTTYVLLTSGAIALLMMLIGLIAMQLLAGLMALLTGAVRPQDLAGWFTTPQNRMRLAGNGMVLALAAIAMNWIIT